MILAPQKDAMGNAIREFHQKQKAGKLRVLSSLFEEDEIPISHLFRSFEKMPPLEQQALSMAQKKVLDVGAAAGCHSLELQKRGLDVTAMDISTLSCQTMVERGVKKVLNQDIMEDGDSECYDTILLLMNGLGMAGTLPQLPKLLKQLKRHLAHGGKIITDSTDLKYLYDEEDLAGGLCCGHNHYYGEIDYQMVYKKVKGEPFNWLYIDFDRLQKLARKEGLKCQRVCQGECNQYLALLQKE